MILPRKLLRGRQALRHLVERDGERVEFLDSPARNHHAGLALCKAFRGPDQAADRLDYPSHGADDRDQEQQQDDRAQPAENGALPLFLL